MIRSAYIFAALALLSNAFADTIVLKDGTVRHGTVQSRTDADLRIHINQNGIHATIDLPMADVVSIRTDAPDQSPPPSSQPSAQTPPIPAPAASQPAHSPSFFVEFFRTAIGNGPDDPRRLPKEIRDLWDNVLAAEALNDKPQLLAYMSSLEEASRKHFASSSLDSLNAIADRLHSTRFDTWMAATRWEIISLKYRNGQFDLRDVREIEKKPLIAILRLNTDKALDPLRPFFPPLKNGTPVPFNVSQLAGLTPSNALDFKNKSLYASAILLTQLRLEPQMPAIDRLFLASQLTNVRRILARTLELEPQARALQQKQANAQKLAQKLAEDRAKKETERTRTSSPPRP